MSDRAKKILFEDLNSLKGTNNNMFADDGKPQDYTEGGNATGASTAELESKPNTPEKQKKLRVFADLDASLILEIDEIIFVETRKARKKNIMNDVKKATIIREMIRKGINAYWKENPRDAKQSMGGG